MEISTWRKGLEGTLKRKRGLVDIMLEWMGWLWRWRETGKKGFNFWKEWEELKLVNGFWELAFNYVQMGKEGKSQAIKQLEGQKLSTKISTKEPIIDKIINIKGQKTIE